MPNITRGDRVAGVMAYLAGRGRHDEDTNPHVVAGLHPVLDRSAIEGAQARSDAVRVEPAVYSCR